MLKNNKSAIALGLVAIVVAAVSLFSDLDIESTMLGTLGLLIGITGVGISLELKPKNYFALVLSVAGIIANVFMIIFSVIWHGGSGMTF